MTEANVSGSWATSMRAALGASLGRPQWWVIALAAFLVRGGIVVVLLPLVTLPSVPALATALAPTIESLVMSRQSVTTALGGSVLIGAVILMIALAAYTGSWLDNELAREAEQSDELDLRPPVVPPSAWRTLAIRLASHLPTLVALGYAAVRIVVVAYRELISPGDPAVPIALRVLGQVPDAIVIAAVAWLLGEAIGGLAARRAAEGENASRAIRGALRDLIGRRGVATFVVTDAAVLGVVVLLISVVGRATEHVRVYLLNGADVVGLGAALLLLVTTWVLALAVLGAALAWRATAWTIEAAPRRPGATEPVLAAEPAAEELPAG